jgi:hypothetical protein
MIRDARAHVAGIYLLGPARQNDLIGRSKALCSEESVNP